MNIHDFYRPFLKYFRKKRMLRFWTGFQPAPTTRILDVGGGAFNWQFIPEQPNLIILNTQMPGSSDSSHSWVVADGCNLPFDNHAFDIVYSNSVIEHLQTLENQRRFAAECSRVGMQYYIQTPNRWFPIEPHLITPFIHWLPKQVQKRLLRNFTLWGWFVRPAQSTADSFLKEVRLLDMKEFQELFPNAEIWQERVLGLSKSLIAVRK